MLGYILHLTAWTFKVEHLWKQNNKGNYYMDNVEIMHPVILKLP